MTTRALGATLLGGALIVSLGWSFVGAPSGGDAAEISAARAGGDTTLRFVTHERHRRDVDLEPVGEVSAGDFRWSSGVVYDFTHSRRIGRYVLRCEATPVALSCHSTTLLRGRGKLYMTQAAVGPDAKGIVTGGTGRFLGVRGRTNMWQRSNGHQLDASFAIELIR